VTFRVTLPSLACLLWLLATVSAAPPGPGFAAELPEPERTRLQTLAGQADVATQVDAEPFVTQLAVFEYLLDHPEFATHVTRTLKIARYRIWRTPEGLFLDDGWGTTGHFWVTYTGPGTRVMSARGVYKRGLLPSIQGEAVTMIEYAPTPAANGKSLVRTTVTGLLKLDSRLAGTALKIVGPVAQKKADKEASRLMRVFAKASRAIEENPTGVLEQLRQRPDIPQRELAEFSRLLTSR
jgi:hypothetical protein